MSDKGFIIAKTSKETIGSKVTLPRVYVREAERLDFDVCNGKVIAFQIY